MNFLFLLLLVVAIWHHAIAAETNEPSSSTTSTKVHKSIKNIVSQATAGLNKKSLKTTAKASLSESKMESQGKCQPSFLIHFQQVSINPFT